MSERKIKFPTKEENRIEATEIDVSNIIFDNMNDKIKITQLESDLSNAVMEIMMIKMGVV